MHPIPSYYDIGSCSNRNSFLQGVTSTETINGMDSILSSRSTAEAKAIAACKSHSEAERRRRKRINSHLATLRTLLPNTIKTDKASLLAEVVRRLKELKKTAAELTARDGDGCSSNSGSSTKECLFPCETDDLRLVYCEGESGLIKATLCCEDRPELVSDLTRALRSVKGKVVRAEMATVGGRTKSVLWVQGLGGGEREEGIGTLRRALKVVVDKPSLSLVPGQALPGNTRPRLSH